MKALHAAEIVTVEPSDFIPMPAKSISHRGVILTRSTLIRGIGAGHIKSRLLRIPGSTKGRRYLLRESLDAFLEKCLVDVPISRDEV